MKRIFELKQERAKAYKVAEDITNKGEVENRELTPDEKSAFDKAVADVAAIDERVSKLEKLADLAPVDEPVEENSRSFNKKNEIRSDVNKYAGNGDVATDNDFYATKEYRNAWLYTNILGDHRAAASELRTFNTTVGTGGYAITPTSIVTDVVQLAEKICFINSAATRYTADALNQQIPILSTEVAPAAYGATEVTATTADTTSAMTARVLTPHIISKLVKISVYSSKLSNLENTVVQQIARSFAYGMENNFLNGLGSGSTQPLGAFTASASGISTARDVSTGDDTSILPDSLFDVVYNLKQHYRRSPKCAWIMHPTVFSAIRKMKSTTNEYLVTPGLNGGVERLLDYPVYLSEFAPNTFTASKYLAILGDWSQYAIAEVPGIDIQRLTELYAATHEVGLLWRGFNDGAPVLEEAFSRLITAAS